MKKYLHKKVIDVPIYRGKLVIVFTNDNKKLKKLGVKIGEKIYATTTTGWYKKTQAYFLILNFKHFFRKIYPGVITHESLHTTNAIAQYCGIVPDVNNDEAMAYIAEWITDQVYKFMNKKGFKI
jgi:hypothetical protein